MMILIHAKANCVVIFTFTSVPSSVSAEALQQELQTAVIKQFGSEGQAPEMRPAIMFRLCTKMCNHSDQGEDGFLPLFRGPGNDGRGVLCRFATRNNPILAGSPLRKTSVRRRFIKGKGKMSRE
jgi:hypothetical protein